MAEFFKTSTVWIVDFHFDGRARRWYRAFGPEVDVARQMAATLRDLYGQRARLAAVRPASEHEESRYLRGEAPKNATCPSGR